MAQLRCVLAGGGVVGAHCVLAYDDPKQSAQRPFFTIDRTGEDRIWMEVVGDGVL
jgi:hypothetical protein